MTSVRCLLFVGVLLAWTALLHGDDANRSADEATLKDAGYATDNPALLDFFRQRTLSDADRDRLARNVRKLGDASFVVREKASADLLAAGRSAVAFLTPALKDPDPEVVSRARRCLDRIGNTAAISQELAAVRLLALHNPPGSAQVLLNYLPFANDEVVEEEVLASLGSIAVANGKADAVLTAALTDRVPERRAAAGFLLSRLPAPARDPRTHSLLTDPDPRVRLRTAQGLIAGKEKAGIPVLIALLGDGPLPAAWSAEELLGRIAGEQAPAVALGAGQETDRRKCRDAWDEWWRTYEAKLDLGPLDLSERLRGLTLLCASDGYNSGKGRVWEIGLDGKTRWEINDVQSPVDAQMLPGNRILIAEQGGRRVTERDMQGKVLWEYKPTGNVVAAQRLPNANTFIATNDKLYEVNREGKEVVTYPGHQGTMWSAVKLRNGHVAYMGSNYHLVELDEKGKEIKSFKINFSGIGLVKPEPLMGGRYLVGQVTNLVELNDAGKVVWECPVPAAASACRLPNGNTLACSQTNRRMWEIDRSGKVLWEQRLEGALMRIRRR
jgi:PQQ-like domain